MFTTQTPPTISRSRTLSSSPAKDRSSLFADFRDRKLKNTRVVWFSLAQAMALAALCSAVAAVVTALLAVAFLHNSSMALQYSSTLTNAHATWVPVLQAGHSALRGPDTLSTVAHMASVVSTIRQQEMPIGVPQVGNNDNKDNGDRPHIAWLMSFPNSGTSFTLHMTREATNTTTGTNYALEGDIKDEPSVPIIPGPAGANGPFLELIRTRHTTIPSMVLTKTHCKGFCSGEVCGPDRTIQTVRSFMTGCLTGRKATRTTKGGLELTTVVYNASLVKRAIHIFRHPLDNIVARFHLEYNVHKARGDQDFGTAFPKNHTGFLRWCAADDADARIYQSPMMDARLKDVMRHIPCRNEFYRYVQWHNLAFSTSRDMGLPTMLLHYHEYATDFAQARDKVLAWLGLPLVGEGIEFHPGKVYRSYYSAEQKQAIRVFLQEVASAETWEQLKDYDFENDESPTAIE